MRFRTRAFLLSFLPLAFLLTGSFWAIETLVRATVRDGLRTSLRQNHVSVARLRERNDLESSRFLKIAGENASLKAGLQLLATLPGDAEARRTVEDQLQEMCEQMGFDFLMVSTSDGKPVAGVRREGARAVPLTGQMRAALAGEARKPGLVTIEDRVYQEASVPVDQGDESLGVLSVGEVFDFAGFSTPAVLMRNGAVLQSGIPGIAVSEVATALRGCAETAECSVRLRGAEYISLPLDQGGGYVLRSLQNVDAASAPVQTVLNRLFLMAALGILLVTFLCSVFSSRSMVRPIAAIISHLRKSDETGLLPEFRGEPSPIREIRDLTDSFNHAASAVREGREKLQSAYVEFVGSLASALDARDRYTSGHSHRVSELSCATAQALGVTPAELETVRVGALLHDIGKIGISDTVLQKTGRLTDEEFALIKLHPEIGRRILEGVQGFAPYLAAVELHHENWDGTGYPRGQSGEETPLAARIIHVSDAYDAMTTDRPYRRGMSHEQAISVLREYAGRHFDPRVVEVFTGLAGPAGSPKQVSKPELAEMSRL